LPGKTRPRNDLLCVEWDVTSYTLTHSLSVRRTSSNWLHRYELFEARVPEYTPVSYFSQILDLEWFVVVETTFKVSEVIGMTLFDTVIHV